MTLGRDEAPLLDDEATRHWPLARAGAAWKGAMVFVLHGGTGLAQLVAARPPKRVPAGIAAGTLAMALVPAVAGANIVVGKSVGGISLGETKAQVDKVEGPPYNDFRDPQFHREETLYAALPGKKTPSVSEVTFVRGKAIQVVTEYPGQKTNRGIGRGSTESAVKRAYPTAKCQAVGITKLHLADCYLEQTVGKLAVVTVFGLENGRVDQVELLLSKNFVL